MSDEAEIAALVNRYASLVDEGDVEAVAALFEDATWRSDRSDVVRRGASEVRPVYEQLAAAATAAPTRHHLTDLSVTVEPGATSASARCRWTVLGTDGGRPAAGLSGEYADRFVKVDGRWRFADRLITTDPADPPTPPPVLG